MAVDAAMYCLDVGQGSCAALIARIPGRPQEYEAVLIDVGCNGTRLAKWLNDYGVARIAMIALTHNDEDHVRGVRAVVHAFKGRIGTLWMLLDRDEHPKRLWDGAQNWMASGWVRQIKRLEAPSENPPGLGEILIGPPHAEFSVHCIYPDLFGVESVVHDAPRAGVKLGTGPNAVSAVLRVAVPTAVPAASSPTQILIGGDLDYPGWNHLVNSSHDLRADVLIAPHHGGPAGATASFGERQFAAAVAPRVAVISVGTDKNSGKIPYGHPHASLIQALRLHPTHVMCTQITPQCVATPVAIAGGAVLQQDRAAPRVCSSGIACAGTVIIRLSSSGNPTVERISEHQTAVALLKSTGHSPLCG